jgi:mevalonate kinase
VKASAPGKIILFGEHAVVYGRPALAVPVTQVRANVEVVPSTGRGIHIEAPNVDLNADLETLPGDHPIAALIRNLLTTWGFDSFPDLTIRVSSTIPVASGLGSGAAVSVALIRALSAALQRPLEDEQVSAFAFEIEKLHHGTPSGIDNAVITYAGPVFFVKGAPMDTLRVKRPFTIVIGDSGLSALTRESVRDVRSLWERQAAKCEALFNAIGELANKAKNAIQDGTWRNLGSLMDENHALLQQLTVSSPELDRLVDAAHAAGALGAKLSGGGRGGNMIALVDEDGTDSVARALTAAGSPRVIVTRLASTS